MSKRRKSKKQPIDPVKERERLLNNRRRRIKPSKRSNTRYNP